MERAFGPINDKTQLAEVTSNNCALASLGMKDYRSALEDLNQVIDQGRPSTRILLLRTRVHTAIGNAQLADADRLAVSGAPVVQINTDAFGGDCHLAAHVIEKALGGIDLHGIQLLIVENVGNLVCPAEFDIGEDARVVILSVTEGEDKPLKYPLMFRVCDVAILNKTDLLPYLDFDMAEAAKNIRQIHPDMPIFEMSSKTKEGMAPWLEWLKQQVENKQKA